MKNKARLRAPFPYFGGKTGAIEQVWAAIGSVQNYVEPFAGSAAMLLGAPDDDRIETINDADGFVANFWRAVAHDPEGVAHAADWPVNEVDLFARHSWLVRQQPELMRQLEASPKYYCSEMAGWWCWGLCAWIGSGWCSGMGPWVHTGERIERLSDGAGINRQLPHLGNAGQGVNRKLPHLGDAGKGINRQLPHLGDAGKGINRVTAGDRSSFIHDWMQALSARLRDVRVCCGDWERVVKDSVTHRNGLTGVFLDPPYTKGAMNYAAGGVGGDLANDVQAWCAVNGANDKLRIVLCGHSGEHDDLLALGWHHREWQSKCGGGYSKTKSAQTNAASETLWCSPACVPALAHMQDLFGIAA